MESYLPHLLHDIRCAHRPEGDGESDFPATIEEELEETERWVLTEPELTFGQYCGLTKEQFPPAERWTEAQLQEIILEFQDMMFSWGVDTDLPNDLPPALTYNFLVKTLDEKIHLMPLDGFTTIEFCESEPMECPFGAEYCACQKFFEEADRNQELSPLHEQVTELAWDIHQIIGRMPETLEFHDAMGEVQSEFGDGGPVYKPLAEWLDIDLERFPPAEELSEWEAGVLASELLSIFDRSDDLATTAKMVSDMRKRYLIALELYSQLVHHDGYGRYHFKPLTEEEENKWLREMGGPLDFLDWDFTERERGEEGEEDSLPF